LVCAGGEFHRRVSSSVTSKQDGFADVALSCERTTVGGSVFVNNGFVAEGRVRFFGAMIGRDLVCPSGSFTNPDATALDLAAATIKGALVLAKSTIKGALVLAKSTIKGKLNLSWAETTRLVDDRSSWPAQLVLDGFTYKVLESPEADLGWKARHDWLQRQTPYQSHPYLQVAAVYRASGRTADARKINVERHNDRLRQRRFHPSNLPRQFLRLSVGHGYEPMRALFWALLVFVVGGLIFSSAGHYQHLLALHPPSAPAPTPTSRRCVPGYPCFNAWVYSADLILPVVNLRQRDNWYVDTSSAAGWYIKYFELFATVTGWALATVVVASFGNLIKRE